MEHKHKPSFIIDYSSRDFQSLCKTFDPTWKYQGKSAKRQRGKEDDKDEGVTSDTTIDLSYSFDVDLNEETGTHNHEHSEMNHSIDNHEDYSCSTKEVASDCFHHSNSKINATYEVRYEEEERVVDINDIEDNICDISHAQCFEQKLRNDESQSSSEWSIDNTPNDLNIFVDTKKSTFSPVACSLRIKSAKDILIGTADMIYDDDDDDEIDVLIDVADKLYDDEIDYFDDNIFCHDSLSTRITMIFQNARKNLIDRFIIN